MVIVTIGSEFVVCKSAKSAAKLLALIEGVANEKGYGHNASYIVDHTKELSMTVVADGRILDERSDSDAKSLLDQAKTDAEAKAKEHDKVRDDLFREKKFWALRNKAHALGINDEQLREKLKPYKWYHSGTEIDLTKGDS